MLKNSLKICLIASISLAIHEGLHPSAAKSISADEYKSSVSKKVIELKFDIQKVSPYIIKLVNTSDQSLSCKLEAHGLIGLLDNLEQSKASMESLSIDISNMDSDTKKMIQKNLDDSKKQVSEANYQILDKHLRITDSVCK
jgi:hypothetical protein